jgi:hypothetical protein
MNKTSALIITSISPPNAVLQAYATGCQEHGIDYIVVGDVSSPQDFRLDGCDFWDIERQRRCSFKLAEILPERHYARKNLGYLVAMSRGAEIIIETDDDNFPYASFWSERQAEHKARLFANSGWVNVYQFFSDARIWPRGFPLEYLQSAGNLEGGVEQTVTSPIHQGLADMNPDVDAVYRLVMTLPQSFSERAPVALGKGSWSPFNSQNTTWFKDAFPLLYIPSYCSFRMCDIWRSFVASRICWANDWPVVFHQATVYQERNQHDLLRDFRDEIEGYLHNAAICEKLARLDIEPGIRALGPNLKKCYDVLIEMGLVHAKERALLDSWLLDLQELSPAGV